MSLTIKAVLEHGRITPLDNVLLPDSCQVLLTIVPSADDKPPVWEKVRKHLGVVRRPVDGQAWQTEIRSEWENRL